MNPKSLLRAKREDGVSNLIGVILILAIALMIMVSAFAVLNTLPPAAQAPASIKMQDMQLENTKSPLASDGYLIVSFIYESGPTLSASSSDFVVILGNVSYQYPLSSLGLSSISAGSVVSFNSSNMTSPDIGGSHGMPLISENSSVGLELTKFGKPVWTSSHDVQMEIVKPVIANSWVSGYIGQQFTLYASVDSEYNVTVTGNFSMLYTSGGYNNVSMSPVGNQNTYEASLPAVKHNSYYEIEVWVSLSSGKRGVVDQWYQLTQSGSAVVSAGVVSMNVFVRGLPGTIWANHDLPIRIGGTEVVPPPSVPAMASMPTANTLPPWYNAWVHIDQNNTSLSTLGYQVVGVTGVDQYLSVNDSAILGVTWDGAQFAGISVVDNGQGQNLTSVFNDIFLLPSSGVVDIYINFTSTSRVVLIGTSNLYNQSVVSFSLNVGGISNGYSVSAQSMVASPPQDVYDYQLPSAEKVTMSGLVSSVGQDVYATYTDGSAFNSARLSPGANVTIAIDAVPLSYGNVTFDVYGLGNSVGSLFKLQYASGSYGGVPGNSPMPVALDSVAWGPHDFSVPSVLYSPNGVYKYVLQPEALPGITLLSTGAGSFSIVYLQQSYSITYVNQTIYYTVTPSVSPVNAGGIYYVVAGHTYYDASSFVSGTEVSFYAYNTSKYFGFSYFTGSIANSYSTASHFTVKLTANDSEVAVFSNLYQFDLSISGYGSVSVTVDYANGSVALREITYTQTLSIFPIQPGSVVQMTESPLYGSAFSGYSGSYSSNSPTYSVTVNSNVSETASFTGGHPPQSITITVNGTGTAYFDGYSTSSSKTIVVQQGTSFTITESPGSNYQFMSYTGAYGSTTETQLSVTVNSNGTEYVNFQPVSVSLTVYINPSGGGSATVNGAVDSSSYTLSVSYGSTVKITEDNSPGYTFAGYSGYDTSSQTSISFTLTGNGVEYVNFNVVYVQVTITLNSNSDGTVYITYNGYTAQISSSITITVAWGTSITLTAYANSGYYFNSYSGTYGSSTNSVATFQATGSGTETASFYPLVQYTVTVIVQNYYTGSAGWYGAASGSTTSLESFNVYSGSSITVYESQSNPNFIFTGFSGNYGNSLSSQMTFTVTQSGDIYASFEYIYSNVTISVNPGGDGTASWSGTASGSTPSSQIVQVKTGNWLTLGESPSSGYEFIGYSGSYSSSSSTSTSFQVTGSGTEYVNFQSLYANVNIEVSPSGKGIVYISGSGISATSTTSVWSGSVLIGTSITLQSSNTVTGWVFNSYSGSFGSSSGSSWSFTVESSGTEYANFHSNAHNFTVIVQPSGADTVTIVWPGNQQPTTTSYTLTYYGSSTSIGLYYGYTSSYTFSSWSGYYSGTGSTAYFPVSGNGTEYANFNPVAITHYTLTVYISPAGGGSVSVNGVSAYSGESFTYTQNTPVTVSESPASGYTFSDYTGTDYSTNTVLSFSITQDMTETANFAASVTYYQVTINVSPGWADTLDYQWGSNTGVTSSSATISVPSGEYVIVSLAWSEIKSGYQFIGFTGYSTTSSDFVNFLPTYSGTETANFEYNPVTMYTVTIDSSGPGYVYFWHNSLYYKTGTWGKGAVSLQVVSGTQITLHAVANPPSGGTWPQFVDFQGTYGNFPQWQTPVTITINQGGYETGIFTTTFHNASQGSLHFLAPGNTSFGTDDVQGFFETGSQAHVQLSRYPVFSILGHELNFE